AAVAAVFLHFLANDVVAQVDTFVTNENGGAGNQLAHFMLALAAEGAIQQLAVVVTLPSHICHLKPLLAIALAVKDEGYPLSLQVQTCQPVPLLADQAGE